MGEEASNTEVETLDVVDFKKDFLDALERLKSRKPTNPDLARRNQRGVLRINVATVAQEAGHSRTLVSHDKCAYPDVRRAILDQRKKSTLAGSMAETNRELRRTNMELKMTVQKARESMAAMARRMEKVLDDARRAELGEKRRANRGSRAPEEVAGAPRGGGTGDNVVPIRGNQDSE